MIRLNGEKYFMTAREKRKKFWDDVNLEMRRHKGTFFVFMILRILVVVSM